MNIPIQKINPSAILPTYAHPGDAGMDMYACETVVIHAGERGLVSTGVAMAIPHGSVGLIWDKSGLAHKNGLTTLAGVIDASYRGEIHVVALNTSNHDYTVEQGAKVAQMLIQSVTQVELQEVASLDDTTRGNGGFGSTGLKH